MATASSGRAAAAVAVGHAGAAAGPSSSIWEVGRSGTLFDRGSTPTGTHGGGRGAHLFVLHEGSSDGAASPETAYSSEVEVVVQVEREPSREPSRPRIARPPPRDAKKRVGSIKVSPRARAGLAHPRKQVHHGQADQKATILRHGRFTLQVQ